MLHRIYRMAKRVPGIGPLANTMLRVTRNIFWAYRPVARQAAAGKAPEDFVAFVAREIGAASRPFRLIEVGAGDGRVLRDLAALYPDSRFVGVDIQKAAVVAGMEHLKEEGVANVELVCASCLEDTISWDCDYLISRTALIYLNRREIELFFSKRLAHIRRGALLIEIVSLTGETESSHFFANPIERIVRQIGNGAFEAKTRLLDYGPWIAEGRWSGAEITIHRQSVS